MTEIRSGTTLPSPTASAHTMGGNTPAGGGTAAAGGTTVETMTVLAPVPQEHLTALAARLKLLKGRPSPFGRAPSTHFARLVILPRDTAFTTQPKPARMTRAAWLTDLFFHAGRPQRKDQPAQSYLLFAAVYDARADGPAPVSTQYLQELRRELKEEADQLFELCPGYPGWSDADGFVAFFADRMVPAGYVFRGVQAQPSVSTIRASLQRRRGVIDLALATDGLPESERASRLRAALPSLERWADVGTIGSADVLSLSPEQVAAAQATVPGPPRTPLPAPWRSITAGPAGVLDYDPPAEPPTEPDLADVQNLVTSGYRRHQTSRHLLLKVNDAVRARAWLARVSDIVPTADWAQSRVHRLDGPSAPSARPARSSAGADPEYPGLAVHVALSFHGLRKMGLPEADLGSFPPEFQDGMVTREYALAPGQGTRAWTGPFAVEQRTGPDGQPEPALRTPVDVLVMLAAPDQAELAARLAEDPWLEPGPTEGLEVLAAFDGGRISADSQNVQPAAGDGGFVEHFGFLDGISQPRIHGVTVGPVSGAESAELPAGEALLGYRDIDGDTAGRGIAAELARNGSFLIYRKLQQDVAAFRQLTTELGRRLESAQAVPPGTDATKLAAAKVLGRWPDGTPVTLRPADGPALDPQTPFGYQDEDFEGFRCPVGAHIRRVNPRDSRPLDPTQSPSEGGDPRLEGQLARRHRMLRRGIPYGAPLPDSTAPEGRSGAGAAGTAGTEASVTTAAGATAAVAAVEDDGDRGLLFVALVADIHRQFEFIQANWLADGNTMRLGADRDLLSGAAPDGSKFIVQGDQPTFLDLAETRRLVTCLGGEYFFLPGISALHRIARAT